EEYIVGVTRDISAKNAAESATLKAEHQAEESEARFRNIANSTSAIIYLADPSGNLEWMNQQSKMDDQVSARPFQFDWQKRIHPDDYNAFKRAEQIARKEKKSYNIEFRLRGSEDEYRWNQSYVNPIFEPSGELSGFVAIITDIHLSRSKHVRQLSRLNNELQE
ncbi:MAG: PAS domain-containing protein, partial [Planctomycetota bacterium]